MEKYRLKQWYPSLHKDWVVGDIVIPWEKQKDYYHVPNKSTTIHKEEVENNPDFWELIEEKKPLFTTDDGVEVSNPEDRVYLVNPLFEKIERYARNSNINTSKEIVKVFYFESNADEYIWKNKPLFSYEEVLRYHKTQMPDCLLRLAKERIMESKTIDKL